MYLELDVYEDPFLQNLVFIFPPPDHLEKMHPLLEEEMHVWN